MATKTRRRPAVSRRVDDQYAILAITPAQLNERIIKKYGSVRAFSRLCGHASHSHIYRMTIGTVRTTSPRTADVMEALLDLQGMLFARMVVKSNDQARKVAA